MYSFTSTVRFSECDNTSKLTYTAMVNYLQDCAVFHSKARDASLEYLQANGMAWMISSWQIKIHEMPSVYDEIVISTWVHDFSRLIAPRYFSITSPDGKVYVEADSLWFMFDFEKMRPTRLTEEINAPYDQDHDTKLNLPDTKRVYKCSGEYRLGNSIQVTKHHLDKNQHVNNAQYIDIALDALGINIKPSYIQVSYLKAALLGDTIIPRIYSDDECYAVELTGEDESIFATVKLFESEI